MIHSEQLNKSMQPEAAPELLEPDRVLFLLPISPSTLPFSHLASLSSFCACLSSKGHRNKGRQSTPNPPPIPGTGCHHIQPNDLRSNLPYSISRAYLGKRRKEKFVLFSDHNVGQPGTIFRQSRSVARTD